MQDQDVNFEETHNEIISKSVTHAKPDATLVKCLRLESMSSYLFKVPQL